MLAFDAVTVTALALPAVVAVPAEVAAPLSVAVIVPAEKFPEPSLITGFEAVLAEANSVCL